MTEHNFTSYAKSKPKPMSNVMHGFTCHVAAMYWIFRDQGETEESAAQKLEGIARAGCQGCGENHNVHISIKHPWYGINMCRGALAIDDRNGLLTQVQKGDVLIVGSPQAPSHSMVVVRVERNAERVYVRGFNNEGTLGTGARDEYDKNDRNVADAQYWHTQGAETRFGKAFSTGGRLYRISYAQYYANAQAIRPRLGN